MSLEKIYGISTEILKKMLDNGDLPCSVIRRHEVYDYYLQYKNSNPSKGRTEIYNDLADHFRLSESSIKQIVLNLDKKS